jgi:hypothetical protein
MVSLTPWLLYPQERGTSMLSVQSLSEHLERNKCVVLSVSNLPTISTELPWYLCGQIEEDKSVGM